jgi:CDP-diacylglycerol--glycerol-3-phosphate 3-phosphatidyltransferase
MAVGFFIVLAFYDVADPPGWPVLDVAMALFLLATVTDMIDGYLARSMGHITTFGRIADPFVDKTIILGTLVFFIGHQFVRPGADGAPVNVTGLAPWMVVVILARELIVTGMRGFSESHGKSFAATHAGKIKMFLQCVMIGWILVYVGHFLDAPPAWVLRGRDIAIWATVVFTAASGLVYVKRAWNLLSMPPD